MSFLKFVRKDVTIQDRITIAALALSPAEDVTISQLARDYQTSRKFIREQIARAEQTLRATFTVQATGGRVIEVTEAGLVRAVRSLALDGHSSVRGIVAHLTKVWDIPIGEGTVVGILRDTACRARQFNRAQDLSAIRMGAQDELFSQRRAVLTGVDVASTYLYLLESPGGRDSTTWGVTLLEKQEQQHLDLERMISDAAKGLRAGMAEASARTIQQGDVFHALDRLQEVGRRLESQAYERLEQQGVWERQDAQRAAAGKDRRGCNRPLARARAAAATAVAVYDRFVILGNWLQELWQVHGYPYPERVALYDWVVDELAQLPGRKVKSLVTYLRNEKGPLLEFVRFLDEQLEQFRQRAGLGAEALSWLCEQRLYTPHQGRYWQLEGWLRRRWGARVDELRTQLNELYKQVVRASSIVEGINSLIRPYLFLRKCVGAADFLALLQFYLNTRKYRRSGRPERVGKSPLELLTGKDHPHWLDILAALDTAAVVEATTDLAAAA